MPAWRPRSLLLIAERDPAVNERLIVKAVADEDRIRFRAMHPQVGHRLRVPGKKGVHPCTQARRLAALSKSSRLFCRITANFINCFEHTDANEQLMPIKIPTNIWSDGPAAESLKNRWWLMGGDMDFR